MVEKKERTVKRVTEEYHKHKHIQRVGKYYKFRESCKDISGMIEITNTFIVMS